tara:strand:+ start:21791 stop:21940 length:150 start_codon:yes stop_codon:yes gene_type:complete
MFIEKGSETKKNFRPDAWWGITLSENWAMIFECSIGDCRLAKGKLEMLE